MHNITAGEWNKVNPEPLNPERVNAYITFVGILFNRFESSRLRIQRFWAVKIC